MQPPNYFYDLRTQKLPALIDLNAIPDSPENEAPVEVKTPSLFGASLTPFIKSKEEIDSLQSINGLTIAEIEKRCRPDGYAMSGFLGENESFKEVLKKDWAAVEQMGTTHAELVAHLKFMIDTARKAPEDDYERRTIFYNPADMPGNTIKSNGPQEFKVGLWATKGIQYDIFRPARGVPRDAQTPDGWNDENIFEHIATGIKIRLTKGSMAYMELFGFYEGGGKENKYRCDPADLMTILTWKKP